MSPKKLEESDLKGTISGPLPAQLRITNKDSRFIQKPPSFTSTQLHRPVIHNSAKRPPIIIYTHSPKIIHAKAHDFMALVQKLTGLSPSENEFKEAVKEEFVEIDSGVKKELFELEDESSSSSMFENEMLAREAKHESTPLSKDCNHYFADAPFFPPDLGDFLCWPRSNSMDFINRFPEC